VGAVWTLIRLAVVNSTPARKLLCRAIATRSFGSLAMVVVQKKAEYPMPVVVLKNAVSSEA